VILCGIIPRHVIANPTDFAVWVIELIVEAAVRTIGIPYISRLYDVPGSLAEMTWMVHENKRRSLIRSMVVFWGV
jgi:hypothetical protein